jgi:hypothetical protein
MRRVTNRDWTEKTIWQSRPLTLAANLEGSDVPLLSTRTRNIYVLVG